MKRDLTVYVASCWWRGSDPHTFVVALTADKAEEAIEDAMLEMAKSATGDEECVCGETHEDEDEYVSCGLDAQAWSGVFPESLRDELRERGRTLPHGERALRFRHELKRDLREQGVAYPEAS